MTRQEEIKILLGSLVSDVKSKLDSYPKTIDSAEYISDKAKKIDEYLKELRGKNESQTEAAQSSRGILN